MSEDENNYLLDGITLAKSANYLGDYSEIGAEYRLPPNYPATVLTREDVEKGYNLYYMNNVSYRATDDGTVHPNDVGKVEEVVVTANRTIGDTIQKWREWIAARIPTIRFYDGSAELDARLNYDLQKWQRGMRFLGDGYSAGGLAKVGGLSAAEKVWESSKAVNSLNDIFKEPEILKNMTIDEVRALAQKEGWEIGTLSKGSRAGEGLTIRDGKNRLIQWHPGGGHHGTEPYWKVSSSEGGTVRIGPQFE